MGKLIGEFYGKIYGKSYQKTYRESYGKIIGRLVRSLRGRLVGGDHKVDGSTSAIEIATFTQDFSKVTCLYCSVRVNSRRLFSNFNMFDESAALRSRAMPSNLEWERVGVFVVRGYWAESE